MPRPRGTAYDALLRRSVEVVRENQDASGAYVACPDFPPYAFCWLRDGSFVADAMSSAGDAASATAFFDWCARVVAARRTTIAELVGRRRAGEPVAADEHLPCRFALDGSDGDGGEWASFQLDGYGMWLWALEAHVRRHRLDPVRWCDGVEATARYLAAFADDPCFDWWEERWGRHTATLAAVHAGLRAAARWTFVAAEVRAAADAAADAIAARVRTECVAGGRLRASADAAHLDASLVACATPFALFPRDDPVIQATVAALEQTLAHGGVHRHEADTFYGGGEWVPLAGLLGLWYAAAGRRDDARAELEWIAAQASDDGLLPEQASAHLLHPSGWDEWVERWGRPATPLLWSHAAFLTLALGLRDPSDGWR